MPGAMPMSVAVSELVTEARGLLMRLTTTVGYRSPSAEHEASEPPCEKLAWETWVMLVVPRDTAVQFACSLVAAMEMSLVPGQGLSRKGKGTHSDVLKPVQPSPRY